eukprot:scaffold1037_cov35-Attheya_sp.AAC.1
MGLHPIDENARSQDDRSISSDTTVRASNHDVLKKMSDTDESKDDLSSADVLVALTRPIIRNGETVTSGASWETKFEEDVKSLRGALPTAPTTTSGNDEDNVHITCPRFAKIMKAFRRCVRWSWNCHKLKLKTDV